MKSRKRKPAMKSRKSGKGKASQASVLLKALEMRERERDGDRRSKKPSNVKRRAVVGWMKNAKRS